MDPSRGILGFGRDDLLFEHIMLYSSGSGRWEPAAAGAEHDD
ncbi:hypothetical protein MES5069_170031 [Mesorhizobium escarrei]|uniref:Uncharacterized protein n=1 Tax=Mesorhizobium escarrei TaxID=666018 RepID=A0ABN8JGL1_9HYPH|nr:hypothetical protein MES5069_170031 [Mesorhizobium escarrei]